MSQTFRRLPLLLALLSAAPVFAQSAAESAPEKKRKRSAASRGPASAAEQKRLKEMAEAVPDLQAKFQWDIPDVVEQVEVPGTVEGLGTPVKLHAVRTKWKLAEIMPFMARAFQKANLYVPPPEHLTKLTSNPQLHAFDPVRKVGFSVIFQPNRDGTTTLILGEANLNYSKPLAGQYMVPLFPKAEGAIQSTTETSTVLAFSTPAPQKDVEKFYADVLPAQGYVPVSGNKYRKGDQQIVVSYHAPSAGLASSVVLTRGPFVEDGPVDPRLRK